MGARVNIYAFSWSPTPRKISRAFAGHFKKMLTQTLRNLEDWGVVKRTVYNVVPPHVEYSLTSLGEKMVEPIALVHGWAQENREDIAKVFGNRLASKTS
ncbi:winged helix-turn-helix transcriptional regulator [Ruegeria arenilitoris]|uniref:winged helix-turn-helix transcriptional regulator n=1 Tax=Ruegeria arenilitoris TaxID=1173585 RepID=UPI003F5CDB23